MLRACCLLLVAGAAALDLASHAGQRGRSAGARRDPPSDLAGVQRYTLHDFVQDYGRSYAPGTGEWVRREAIFQTNLQKVSAFFAEPELSWTSGITQFMDYSAAEYSQLMGYKGRRSRAARGSRSASGVMSPLGAGKPVADLHSTKIPAMFFLPMNGSLMTLVRDQGACGSCWAAASTTALEGHLQNKPELLPMLGLMQARLGNRPPTLSSQAMVSCTPNERHCGGKGGCDGATAELAYTMVKERGLPLAVAWPYDSGSRGVSHACRDSAFAGIKIGIKDYTVLPQNKFIELKQAIVNTGGPIVVSVDATNWNFYRRGIYSDTSSRMGKGDFTVNHAVTLMGYTDPSPTAKGYWLIKNSWGQRFGERGYIRVEMKANEQEHCGWDEDTHIGLACDGDPDRAWVCGTCGILYDSSYPVDPYIMK